MLRILARQQMANERSRMGRLSTRCDWRTAVDELLLRAPVRVWVVIDDAEHALYGSYDLFAFK